MEPSKIEIEEQIEIATDCEIKGRSKFPGMTYEQGVRNALEWVLGYSDSTPMED